MTVRDLALVPVPTSAPARFVPWDDGIVTRAYELWASIAGRNAARTVRLLGRELGEDASLPDASTVWRWSIEKAWAARANADLEQSDGRTLHELQTGWLAAQQLAQATLLDAMAGAFDDLPFGGAGRLKAAEITLRTIERSGLLAVMPAPPKDADIDVSKLSTEEKQALARDILQERKRNKASA
jgi:hypothetical protein